MGYPREGRRNGGGRSFGHSDMTPPVKVGDELDVTIEAVGEKGDGIAKKDGFVLFVPNVKQGQKCHIRITKVLRKVGFAESTGASTASAEDAPAEEGSSETAEEQAEEESEEDSENFGEEQ